MNDYPCCRDKCPKCGLGRCQCYCNRPLAFDAFALATSDYHEAYGTALMPDRITPIFLPKIPRPF